MYALLSLSNSELKVIVTDDDKQQLNYENVENLMKARQEEESASEDSNSEEDNTSDQVEGGKVNLKKYNEDPKAQTIEDRLVDPLDGGEANYKPRGNATSIKDSIRIKPLSHNARNPHER